MNIIKYFLLIILTSIALKSQAEPYLQLRASLQEGSTTFQSENGPFGGRLSGQTYELIAGLNFSNIIRIGVLGVFDNLALSGNTTIQGRVNNIGYGGVLRVYFMSKIFIEGGGGGMQTQLSRENPTRTTMADGTYYYVGPGVEFHLGRGFSFEVGVYIRNVMYSKNEFENTKGILYSISTNFYFF